MIVVSATDPDNDRASFSSYGNMVDIAAPGGDDLFHAVKSGYGYGTGTSSATPIVAGTVALMPRPIRSFLTASQIESILYGTAARSRHGRIRRIYLAMASSMLQAPFQAALNSVGSPADTTPPSGIHTLRQAPARAVAGLRAGSESMPATTRA